MKTLLSDNGQYVLVFEDGCDEPEQMTREEFKIAFGEDIESDEPSAEWISDELKHYYRAFSELCKRCGEFAWANKLAFNAADGILPAQEVAYDYFGGTKGDPDKNLARKIEKHRRAQELAANYLDDWSQRLGYKPMSETDKKILIQHLYRSGFRQKIRYRIERNLNKGVSVSARDLVVEVLMAERKLRKR